MQSEFQTFLDRRYNQYKKSNFYARVTEIRKHPNALKNRADLLAFWTMATEERLKNRDLQDLIATDAFSITNTLRGHSMRYEKIDELWDIAMTFASLDHLLNWQPKDSTEKAWLALAKKIEATKG